MKLYKFQQEILQQTKNENKVAYYLDMGLGKTFVGSEKMVQLGTKINLVICQKSKLDDWIDHFTENYEESEDMMIYNLTKWKKDDWAELKADPEFKTDWHNASKYVLIINYDLIWRRKELLKLHIGTLMLDESSLIQNESSNRSAAIIGMNFDNVILLSGTPTGGKYETLWSQLHLLGWNISKEMYWNHYVDYEWDDSQGFPLKKINGYKNENRLKKKMRNHGCIFLKTDQVYDLPDQIHQKVFVDRSSEYKTFTSKSIVDFNGITLVGDTILKKLLYARQLCGQYNNDKLNAFQDLVESTEDRLIVFYNFNEELDQLQKVVSNLDRPYGSVNGQIKNLKPYELYDNSVTFVQYQAGAMGLNLQKANKIIYFTPPLSSELFEQSKKRIHRLGQDRSCFYYYLICKRSVEEHIYSVLAMRKDYTDNLFTMCD